MINKNIVWIIIGIILLMSALAFYKQSGTSKIVSQRVSDELIIPYSNYLKSGNIEKAYSELTSKDYRTNYTFAQYRKAQDSNHIIYGNLVDLKPVSGIFLKETGEKNKVIFKATFAYKGSRSSQRIIIDAVLENGKFKLYKTYNSYVSIGGLMPVIY